MGRKVNFTTVTGLPKGLSRETVLGFLHDHLGLIDLQPMVEKRHPIRAPHTATPEEAHCAWYELTDKVHYLPGGLYSGKVSYNLCFNDLSNGVQSHCYAPLGTRIKSRWTLGGSLPGEPREPVELGLGIPREGLWLREDVELECNLLMTSFVKKSLKTAHDTLVERMVQKGHLREAEVHNANLAQRQSMSSSGQSSGLGYPGAPGSPALHSPQFAAQPLPHGSPTPAYQAWSPAQHPAQQFVPPPLGMDQGYKDANPYRTSHQSVELPTALNAGHFTRPNTTMDLPPQVQHGVPPLFSGSPNGAPKRASRESNKPAELE